MGQAAFVASLALVIGIILAATTAAATSAVERSSRAINLSVLCSIVALAISALQRAEMRINFTSSLPIGIYMLLPLPPYGVKRGMLVAACAPLRAAVTGKQRGYLAAGPCPGDTELLLKSVAAIPGDEVDVNTVGVLVNGNLLPRSYPAPCDPSGRELAPWPVSRYRLKLDEVWLYANDERSWDSRYWGPVSYSNTSLRAIPLLVIPKKAHFGDPNTPICAYRGTLVSRSRAHN